MPPDLHDGCAAAARTHLPEPVAQIGGLVAELGVNAGTRCSGSHGRPAEIDARSVVGQSPAH
jgi:hypothetical protein